MIGCEQEAGDCARHHTTAKYVFVFLLTFFSSSYGKRLDDPSVTSANTGTSSSGLGHLNSVLSQRYTILTYDMIR